MDTATTYDSGVSSDTFGEDATGGPGLANEKPKPPGEFLVALESVKDPLSPQNWPFKKKFLTAFSYGLCCLCSTFASAVLSPATGLISNHFNVSNEATILSTATLFLLGYVAGPFAWAPLSEHLGRKLPMSVAMFGFVCFGAGSASAKDYQTLCITRFFQGTMGACPVAITTASYADMFSTYHRAYATTIFGFTVFSGPMLASPLGGFTADNHALGWRWDAWWTVLTGAAGLFTVLVCASKTYLPHLLKRKAIELRHETGEWAFHSKLEENRQPLRGLLKSLFRRPFQMLYQEPILGLITLYTAFIYALLYTFLDAYTVVFVEGYHINVGTGGLPFIGLILGLALAAAANILQQRFYVTPRLKRNNGVMIPEWRMPIAMSGAVAFPLGLFWFGWTGAYPGSVHWIVPTASGLVSGYGILIIFNSFFAYLIDVYKTK